MKRNLLFLICVIFSAVYVHCSASNIAISQVGKKRSLQVLYSSTPLIIESQKQSSEELLLSPDSAHFLSPDALTPEPTLFESKQEFLEFLYKKIKSTMVAYESNPLLTMPIFQTYEKHIKELEELQYVPYYNDPLERPFLDCLIEKIKLFDNAIQKEKNGFQEFICTDVKIIFSELNHMLSIAINFISYFSENDDATESPINLMQSLQETDEESLGCVFFTHENLDKLLRLLNVFEDQLQKIKQNLSNSQNLLRLFAQNKKLIFNMLSYDIFDIHANSSKHFDMVPESFADKWNASAEKLEMALCDERLHEKNKLEIVHEFCAFLNVCKEKIQENLKKYVYAALTTEYYKKVNEENMHKDQQKFVETRPEYLPALIKPSHSPLLYWIDNCWYHLANNKNIRSDESQNSVIDSIAYRSDIVYLADATIGHMQGHQAQNKNLAVIELFKSGKIVFKVDEQYVQMLQKLTDDEKKYLRDLFEEYRQKNSVRLSKLLGECDSIISQPDVRQTLKLNYKSYTSQPVIHSGQISAVRADNIANVKK